MIEILVTALISISPGWNASLLQGYPKLASPFTHLGGEREYESKVSCPRTQHNDPSSPYPASRFTLEQSGMHECKIEP